MLGFSPYWDIRHISGRQNCHLYAPAALYAPDISWYSFLLESEWTPGLMNVHGKNRLLENFQEPYRESNPEPAFGAIRTIFM